MVMVAQAERVKRAIEAHHALRSVTGNEFGGLLCLFRERAGKSRNALAKEVGVDPSYLTRIEFGDRGAPGLPIVQGLIRALKLSGTDANRFLVSAGYAPAPVLETGWCDAYQSIADVLSDWHLSEDDKDEFTQMVCVLSLKWRRAQAETPCP